MQKFMSGVLFLLVFLLLLSIAGVAAASSYSAPSHDLPTGWAAPLTPGYWKESKLVNRLATRSGPGGNKIYTEELATFRLGEEIARDATVLVGWKESSTAHPRTGEVNGVYWAMVEFTDANGDLYRAYVEIDGPTKKPSKQVLSIDPSIVPYEHFDLPRYEITSASTRMYYGPGTHYKVVTQRTKAHRDTRNEIILPVGTAVKYVCSDNGYALIEFDYPSWLDAPSDDSGPLMRAWIRMDAIGRR